MMITLTPQEWAYVVLVSTVPFFPLIFFRQFYRGGTRLWRAWLLACLVLLVTGPIVVG